jgi:hypothetical protein
VDLETLIPDVHAAINDEGFPDLLTLFPEPTRINARLLQISLNTKKNRNISNTDLPSPSKRPTTSKGSVPRNRMEYWTQSGWQVHASNHKFVNLPKFTDITGDKVMLSPSLSLVPSKMFEQYSSKIPSLIALYFSAAIPDHYVTTQFGLEPDAIDAISLVKLSLVHNFASPKQSAKRKNNKQKLIKITHKSYQNQARRKRITIDKEIGSFGWFQTKFFVQQEQISPFPLH